MFSNIINLVKFVALSQGWNKSKKVNSKRITSILNQESFNYVAIFHDSVLSWTLRERERERNINVFPVTIRVFCNAIHFQRVRGCIFILARKETEKKFLMIVPYTSCPAGNEFVPRLTKITASGLTLKFKVWYFSQSFESWPKYLSESFPFLSTIKYYCLKLHLFIH
jgi:hypothetical protein